MKKIGVVVGSLRKGSFNKIVANYLGEQLKNTFEVVEIPVGDLPLYNEDLDTDTPPKSWETFRETVKEMDAFLFATPEYNRSVPAAIKNALDVGSRPYMQNVWEKKPCAVVSVSMGKLGGYGATHHLKDVLAFLDMYIMPQPEAYVGELQNALDENGAIADAGMQSFLDTIAAAFTAWINRLS